MRFGTFIILHAELGEWLITRLRSSESVQDSGVFVVESVVVLEHPVELFTFRLKLELCHVYYAELALSGSGVRTPARVWTQSVAEGQDSGLGSMTLESE